MDAAKAEQEADEAAAEISIAVANTAIHRIKSDLVTNHGQRLLLIYSETQPLSNWFPTSFVLADRQFCNVEQFFQWQKAKCFGDNNLAEQILETTNPTRIRRLGLMVRGFSYQFWIGISERMPIQSILALFDQLIGMPIEELQLVSDFYPFLQNLLCRGQVYIMDEQEIKQKPFAFVSLYRSSDPVKNSPAPRVESNGNIYRLCVDNRGMHVHLYQLLVDLPVDPSKARTFMEAFAFLKAPLPSLPHPKAFPKQTRAREIFYDLNDHPVNLPWTLNFLFKTFSLAQLDRRYLLLRELVSQNMQLRSTIILQQLQPPIPLPIRPLLAITQPSTSNEAQGEYQLFGTRSISMVEVLNFRAAAPARQIEEHTL